MTVAGNAAGAAKPMLPEEGAAGESSAQPGQPGLGMPLGLLRVLLFLACLLLFPVAIELIKNGSTGAAGLIEGFLDINSPVSALGFGWFASYLVMSGSPVAAVSVAFLAKGAIEWVPAFTTIVESRLGASFIVLCRSMCVLRGHERRAGLTMGLLTLVEQATGPLVELLSGFLPGWGVMLVGLGAFWASFYLLNCQTLPANHRFVHCVPYYFYPKWHNLSARGRLSDGAGWACPPGSCSPWHVGK